MHAFYLENSQKIRKQKCQIAIYKERNSPNFNLNLAKMKFKTKWKE